jgi:hypothetical protein
LVGEINSFKPAPASRWRSGAGANEGNRVKVTLLSSLIATGKLLELVGVVVVVVVGDDGTLVDGVLVVDSTGGLAVVVVVLVDDVGGIDDIGRSTTSSSSSQLSWIGTTPGVWLSTTALA